MIRRKGFIAAAGPAEVVRTRPWATPSMVPGGPTPLAVGGPRAELRRFGAGLINPHSGYLSKLALIIGLAYPFGPIDLIPNHIPVIGYADQVAFVIGGIALAYLLLPPSAQPQPAVTRQAGMQRPAGLAARLRAFVLDSFAILFATPLLRLSTGAWPAPAETAAFRHAFRNFTPLPPLMRALATVPAGREHLTRAMLAGWLLADETYKGKLRGELLAETGKPGASPAGNRLTVWSGPPVTFLHLEKTAGMSVVSALSSQFHPLQIDADLRRTFPPHVLTPLPPFLIERVRRSAFVWGHYDVPSIRRLGNGRFTFTFLREPRARIVSLYRYWRAQASLDLGWNGMNQPVLAAQRLTLAEFLHSEDPWILDYIDNFYVRRLTGLYATGKQSDPVAASPDQALRVALAALDGFDFIGLTEDTAGSLKQLAGLLGFPPPPRVPRVNVTRQATDAEDGMKMDPAVETALDRLTRLDRQIYQAAQTRFAPGTSVTAPDPLQSWDCAI